MTLLDLVRKAQLQLALMARLLNEDEAPLLGVLGSFWTAQKIISDEKINFKTEARGVTGRIDSVDLYLDQEYVYTWFLPVPIIVDSDNTVALDLNLKLHGETVLNGQN